MAEKKQLKRRQALGKGLGALLSDTNNNSEPEQESVGGVAELTIASIQANPFQPRTEFSKDALEELSESIAVHGIIQPITVRRLDANSYQIISGERRYQASKLAGLLTVPAYVREANDQQMLEMALVENIQREDLNPIEIALTYQRLIAECSLRQEDLGERVGKKRTTVTNYLRLLKLPPDVQSGLISKVISMGHARALLGIEDITLQLMIYKQILQEGLSVRKVEELVRKAINNTQGDQKEEKEAVGPSALEQYELKQLQVRLSSQFGTKVNISFKGADKGGAITIPYLSTDDLNRILEILEK